MEAKEQVKLKSYSYYSDAYFKKLNDTGSVVQPLAALTGGWYLETFKQVINKLSKNRSSPLPLFFPNIEAMDPISKNKPLLRTIFKVFDTRGVGRIDACELYAACMLLSRGSYQVYLKTIVDVFGFESAGKITRNEMFYFLDSLFRAASKILIVKGCKQPQDSPGIRLDFKDINRFLGMLFEEGKAEMERNQIYEIMMKSVDLNEFLKYLQKKCLASVDNSRNESIQRIKIQTEVKKCLSEMVALIHSNLA